MTTELRDYQQEMLARLEKAWHKQRSVMVQMPTGTGKTVLMAEVIRNQELRASAQVLVVAHRRELLEQIRGTIASFGIDLEKADVMVESIQKLSRGATRNSKEGEKLRKFTPSLVIIDEAHHALAKTYKMLWERWPKAKFLGLTATPCRLSGEAFTDLFDTLLLSWSIQEFIDKGWLSDFEYVSAKPTSLMALEVRKLKKRSAGDYQEAEMATVLDVPESIAHLYKTYQRYAEGKKGIVYAINRQHAQHITEYYQAQGVKCAVIDSKTPEKERERLVAEYRQQQLDVLVNVDIFGEGFDVPEVEFIQLARPTLSVSKYLQQVGRGMRVSEGKPHVLILDNVGLYQTFGLPTEERDWKKMFLGKLAGTGHEGRIVLVDENTKGQTEEKELVNLDMVRIKKGGRKGSGLEIFMQGALYGVMFNGRVTCPAKFKEITRVDKESQFFAVASFVEIEKRPSSILYLQNTRVNTITTVINKKGEEMDARFYDDKFDIQGDFVAGYRYYDASLIAYWWDSKAGNYYPFEPIVRVVKGMEFVCKGLMGMFRYVTGMVNPKFSLPNLYYNHHIALNKYYLVVRGKPNHVYIIEGYLEDCVIVKNDKSYGYLQIARDGMTVAQHPQKPHGMTLVPNYPLLQVKQIGRKTFDVDGINESL